MATSKDLVPPAAESTRETIRSGIWVAPNTQLRESDLAQLRVVVPARSYAKGDAVYRQGDPADSFYIVVGGSVKIVAPGAERVLAVCGPDDMFGAEACANVPQHRSEAVSMTDGTEVVTVSDAHFREAARRGPAVAYAVASVLARRVQVLEEEAEHARLPAQARLARTLLALARRFGSENVPGTLELELDLRHDEIASLANTTRVSATRALASWREMGLVRGTRGLYFIDERGLVGLIDLLEEENLS